MWKRVLFVVYALWIFCKPEGFFVFAMFGTASFFIWLCLWYIFIFLERKASHEKNIGGRA